MRKMIRCIRSRRLSAAITLVVLTAGSLHAQILGPSLYYVFVRASRVALLPFVNLTETTESADRIMSDLRSGLQRKSVELADSGHVAGILRKYRIRNTAEPTIEQIHRLSEELDVSFLLVGTLDYLRSEHGSSEVGLSARLIYIPSVEIVWQASASAHSDDISLPLAIGRKKDLSAVTEQAASRLLRSFRYSPVENKTVEIVAQDESGDRLYLPCRSVMVLPFFNGTSDRAAGYAIADNFSATLLSEGYPIIERARVRQALLERGGITHGELSREQLTACREELGVDFVLTGTISDYGNSSSSDDKDNPLLALHARLIDTRDGTVVWAENCETSGYGRTVLFGFGAIHGLGHLTRNVVHDMVGNIPHRFRTERQLPNEPVSLQP